MKRKVLGLLALLLAGLILLAGCGGKTGSTAGAGVTGAPEATEYLPGAPAATEYLQLATAAPTKQAGPIIKPQEIADYLFTWGELPENFITKQEAKDLGWDSSWNYVSDVAPGMSIGGDYFGNYEGKLPKIKGRKYYECDCWYTGGKRTAYRIIYSNDGHVWYTEDHYNTFTEMSPSEKSASEKSVSEP